MAAKSGRKGGVVGRSAPSTRQVAAAAAALAALIFAITYMPNLIEPGCGRLHSDVLKDRCISDFAASKGDASLCGQMSGPAKKDECVRRVRLESEGKTVCDFLEYPLAVSKCNSTMAGVFGTAR
jgi:hypothetical protein